MVRVKEAIVVEGKYDKAKLSSLVDGVIIETKGFGIFRDKERMELLRRLAGKTGLVVLTDSDGAGFLIRSKLCSVIPPEQVKHAYIPDILGKEKRKRAPSKEGKLGVEGMEAKVLLKALERAGVTAREEASAVPPLTKADLYALGLSGKAESARKRKALLAALELPERLSSNGLLRALNAMYRREEFFALCEGLWEEER